MTLRRLQTTGGQISQWPPVVRSRPCYRFASLPVFHYRVANTFAPVIPFEVLTFLLAPDASLPVKGPAAPWYHRKTSRVIRRTPRPPCLAADFEKCAQNSHFPPLTKPVSRLVPPVSPPPTLYSLYSLFPPVQFR